MIKLNIKTYNKVEVKRFVNFYDLEKFCRKLCLLVGDRYDILLNEAEDLASKIWDTNVGQYVESNLGHKIVVTGKSPYHNTEHGKQMYGS